MSSHLCENVVIMCAQETPGSLSSYLLDHLYRVGWFLLSSSYFLHFLKCLQ
jgi:hypothetical protein